MKMQAGLWIDHRKVVIVSITGAGQETKEIESNMEKKFDLRAALPRKMVLPKMCATVNTEITSTFSMTKLSRASGTPTPFKSLGRVRQRVNWKNASRVRASADALVESKRLTR